MFVLIACLAVSCSGREPLVEVGSRWTDGMSGYEVVSATADSVFMESCTDYDEGVVVIARGDGGWMVDGAGGFGFHRSPVRRQVMAGRDLLVASYPADADGYYDDGVQRAGRPMQVFERFDGNVAVCALMAVRRFLAGVYTDTEDTSRVWTFYPDGTVSMASGMAPLPYRVGSSYRGLTNVVQMPDGEEWEFVLDGGYLYISPAERDGETRRMGYTPDLGWLRECLFCPAVQSFLTLEWRDALQRLAEEDGDAFARLNACVIAASRSEGSL